MSNDILSQDEVDALLGGVDDGLVDTDGDGGEFDGDARSFDFDNQERIIRGRLPTLEMINQRFARNFRISFFGMYRKTPDITAEGLEMVKFSEYVQKLLVPTSLSLIRMTPLKGLGLIMLDPKLVFLLVDNFFGGDGSIHAKIEGREFTQTELRVIKKVVELCFTDLTRAWAPVMAVKFIYHAHEVNPHMANIGSPTEIVIVSKFNLEIDGGGGEIHIVYPYSKIEPIRNLLDAGVLSDRGIVDERWAILMREELMNAKVDLQGLFTEKQIPVKDLLNFKVGDIIPIDLPEQVLLLAEDMPIIRGQYGEHQGNAAIKVEEVVEIFDPENEEIKQAITRQE